MHKTGTQIPTKRNGLTRPGPKGVQANIAYLRQCFLYGMGDGVPVVDCTRLCKIGNVTRETISQYLPAWEREREEMLQLTALQNGGRSFNLTQETYENHKKDTKFLENQKNKIKEEIENLKGMNEGLFDYFDALSERTELDSEDKKAMMSMVRSFINSCKTRNTLLTQFLRVQNAWKDNVGIQAELEAAKTGMKTTAQEKVKLIFEGRKQELRENFNRKALVQRDIQGGEEDEVFDT